MATELINKYLHPSQKFLIDDMHPNQAYLALKQHFFSDLDMAESTMFKLWANHRLTSEETEDIMEFFPREHILVTRCRASCSRQGRARRSKRCEEDFLLYLEAHFLP